MNADAATYRPPNRNDWNWRTDPRPAVGRMPFFGHRTQREVRQDEARREIMRDLGRGPKMVTEALT